MANLNISPLARQSLVLNRGINEDSMVIETVGKFKKTSTGSGVVGKQFITLSLGTNLAEGAYIDVTEEPELVEDRSEENLENIYSYSLLFRGIDSDNKDLPPTKHKVENRGKHPAGSFVGIVIDPSFFSSFVAGVADLEKEILDVSLATRTASKLSGRKFYSYLAKSFNVMKASLETSFASFKIGVNSSVDSFKSEISSDFDQLKTNTESVLENATNSGIIAENAEYPTSTTKISETLVEHAYPSGVVIQVENTQEYKQGVSDGIYIYRDKETQTVLKTLVINKDEFFNQTIS